MTIASVGEMHRFWFSLLTLVTLGGCSSSDDDATCAEEHAPFYCVRKGCGGDLVNPPACENGEWVCPSGWVHPDTCPDDACFHVPAACCDALGNFSSPSCPNHASEVCPTDSYLIQYGGSCPGAGLFPCGANLNCKLGTEYCRLDANSTATCETLPSGCHATPTCSCMKSLACDYCHSAGIGAVQLNCH